MPSEDVAIMGTVIPEANVSLAAKIRDGVKERQVIQQFGCRTAQNAVSVIDHLRYQGCRLELASHLKWEIIAILLISLTAVFDSLGMSCPGPW